MASINPESQIWELEHTKSGHQGAHIIIKYSGFIDLVLRVNLFVTTLTPVILLATSKQTVFVKTPFIPNGASITAKFTDEPSMIYAIAALSVACLYSIVTSLLSFSVLMKQATPSTKSMFSIFVIDLLLLGMVAAASGAAGDTGYIGLKGNEHTGWQKRCNIYDTYCLHIGFSVLSSSAAAMILILLILLYVFKV